MRYSPVGRFVRAIDSPISWALLGVILLWFVCPGLLAQQPTVTLLDPVQFPIVLSGRVAGSMTAPTGSRVSILKVNGDRILVSMGTGSVWVDRIKVRLPNAASATGNPVPAPSPATFMATPSPGLSPTPPPGPAKAKLQEEYYRLIESDPVAARKCRDQFMALVNQGAPPSPLVSFMLGSQYPTPLDEDVYKAYRGKFSQAVACTLMTEIGSDILKISPTRKNLIAQGVNYTGSEGLGDLLRHPVYKKILDLPYRIMCFWAHGEFGNARSMSEQQRAKLHDEFFDLTRYLLTEYTGSGKTFLLGNWEGDWMAGGKSVGNDEDLLPEKLRAFQEWLNIRCKAIDEAKAATPHKNVAVYSYLEINHIDRARTKGVKRLVNGVLPYSRVDFVSISSYEMQGYGKWGKLRTEERLRPLVFDNLDFVESNLPPRDVPGKRVFIGEIGFTPEEIAKRQQLSTEEAYQEQARLALIQAKVDLEWGVPLWLWWATFSSSDGNFGLVQQATGTKTPLYQQYKTYCQWAGEFTEQYRKEHGSVPDLETFRKQAIGQLKKQIALLPSFDKA